MNYFRLADMCRLLKGIDGCMRRRIHLVYWKQWKRVRTRFKMLQKCGIERDGTWQWAHARKFCWRTADSGILSRALGNESLKEMGYLFFLECYDGVRAC